MLTVPNTSYHTGRLAPVRLVVLHTAECPCEPGRAEAVARYLAQPSVKASAHWVVDPDTTVAQVAESDTAWTAPGANADGIQIEQCGYAAFGLTSQGIPESNVAARRAYGSVWPNWDHPEAARMLRTQTAPLLAAICQRWGLPPVPLDAAGVLAGKRGVCDHATINAAYRRSDHWDCGGSYPLAVVCLWADEIIRGALSPQEDTARDGQNEEDIVKAWQVTDGELKGNLFLIGHNQCRMMNYPARVLSYEQLAAACGALAAKKIITLHEDGSLFQPITNVEVEMLLQASEHSAVDLLRRSRAGS